uniref:Catalase n=1 Tax=Lygus hesperus TaxID=30085 RepID=A0A0A9YHA6_LYGHE
MFLLVILIFASCSLSVSTRKAERKVIGNYTRADGVPIYDNLNSITAGRFGPIVLQDVNFLDDMQHFDRERIPERVVHAKGAGAFGYFLCTNDLSKYTQASVLSTVGKRTPLAVRFSRIGGNAGEADTVRDGRGFAIKFFTDQGNWDLVGLNLPVFWIRDTMRFSSLIHANKRNPVTNLYDPVMFWDFMSLLPETLAMILNVFSDKGIPMSYRTMDGHSTNSFSLTRRDGKITFVKFHLKSNQGVQNMPPDQAATTAGVDADFHVRDLFDYIAKGNFPSWNMSWNC